MRIRFVFLPVFAIFGFQIAVPVHASGLPKTSIQAIIKSLQDSNADVRTAAAQALASAPDDAATHALETALIASSDAKEQDALVSALLAVNDKATVKHLMESLSNPQFTWGNGAKPRAVELIGQLADKDKKVTKWLTDIAAGEQEPAVRAAALRALGVIGAPPKKEKK
jgi:HEAT repeat protein